MAVLDDLGRAFESRHLRNAGHVPTIPLDAELEILVRVETQCVDSEFRHGVSSKLVLSRDLTGYLLQLHDDELGGLERREADENMHDAPIDVVLCRGVLIAL